MSKAAAIARGEALLARFLETGAERVVPDILLPAETLLDLYGEDIRARAYVTPDPLRGEMMLRPDFTVPVVQMHAERLAAEKTSGEARYAYLGEVFRKQDNGENAPDAARPAEYFQVGYELFSDVPDADAELFALFHETLRPYGVRAVMGDMGLLIAAIDGLPLLETQRAALRHHLWRPARFERLLDAAADPHRTVPPEPASDPSCWSGRRGPEEMLSRHARLRAEADAPALEPAARDRLRALMAISAPIPEALAQLEALASEWPALNAPVEALSERFAQIKAHGIALDGLVFDGSHGRQTMEYYDGMTFSFRPDTGTGPALASGGRYDALTRQLGHQSGLRAVGGIIRPGLLDR